MPHQHEALFKGTVEEKGKTHHLDGITKWLIHIMALLMMVYFALKELHYNFVPLRGKLDSASDAGQYLNQNFVLSLSRMFTPLPLD